MKYFLNKLDSILRKLKENYIRTCNYEREKLV